MARRLAHLAQHLRSDDAHQKHDDGRHDGEDKQAEYAPIWMYFMMAVLPSQPMTICRSSRMRRPSMARDPR
jgi:hypothetical protein